MNKIAFAFYVGGVLMLLPAWLDTLLSNYLLPAYGYLSFWDIYEEYFMMLAFASLVLFFAASAFFEMKSKPLLVLFNMTATAAVISAIPDINGYIAGNGDPALLGMWFGIISFSFIMMNMVVLNYGIILPGLRGKGVYAAIMMVAFGAGVAFVGFNPFGCYVQMGHSFLGNPFTYCALPW